MAAQGTRLSRACRTGWLRGRRHRNGAAGSALAQERAACDARMPWLARHLALWSRTVAPLRPLSASAACAQARNASWPVARDLGSVGHARRKVTTRLSEWGMSDLADTVELLVSELVTNALRHTHGPVRLNLCLRGLHLRCEVEDADSAARYVASPPPTRRVGAVWNLSTCLPRTGEAPARTRARSCGSNCRSRTPRAPTLTRPIGRHIPSADHP